MSDLDRLISEFKEEHERDGAADPQRYLAQVSGRDRLSLETMIDAHLAAAPRRAWNETEFRRSGAADLIEGIEQSLGATAGTWPALLPQLRNRAQITREELTSRLADALGVGERREKVHAYYHQMERGTLQPEGVSQRVLDALGRLVGESAEALRRAGAGMGGPPEEAGVFARTTMASAPAAEPADEMRPQAEEWDEVDELFRGG